MAEIQAKLIEIGEHDDGPGVLFEDAEGREFWVPVSRERARELGAGLYEPHVLTITIRRGEHAPLQAQVASSSFELVGHRFHVGDECEMVPGIPEITWWVPGQVHSISTQGRPIVTLTYTVTSEKLASERRLVLHATELAGRVRPRGCTCYDGGGMTRGCPVHLRGD